MLNVSLFVLFVLFISIAQSVAVVLQKDR